MKHENPTVNHVLHDPLWEIFMPSANASALHIIAPPTDICERWKRRGCILREVRRSNQNILKRMILDVIAAISFEKYESKLQRKIKSFKGVSLLQTPFQIIEYIIHSSALLCNSLRITMLKHRRNNL